MSSGWFEESGIRTKLIACALALCAAPALAFDRAAWREDLAQVRQTLATKYANLEWVVFDHETNLAELFGDTEARIDRAGNDSEARAAFDRLADKLGDEHVGFKWPAKNAGTQNVRPDRCAALGYDERSRGKPLAADADGYRPLGSAASDEFPAGLIAIGRRKIGVLKIGVFMPQGYPAFCRAAIAQLGIPKDAPCDDACEDRIASFGPRARLLWSSTSPAMAAAPNGRRPLHACSRLSGSIPNRSASCAARIGQNHSRTMRANCANTQDMQRAAIVRCF